MDHHLIVGLAAAFVLAGIGMQLLWYGEWEVKPVRTRFLRGFLGVLSVSTGNLGLAGIMLIVMALAGVVTALLGDPFYVAFRNMLAPPFIILLLRYLPFLLFDAILSHRRDR